MSNAVTQEYEALHREQSAEEARTRPSKRKAVAHYSAEAALGELVLAMEAMLERYADGESLDSPIDARARAALAKFRGQS